MSDRRYVRRADTTPGPGVKVDITPANAGWGWSGLRVVDLGPGDSMTVETQENEILILPLSGSFTVQCGP